MRRWHTVPLPLQEVEADFCAPTFYFASFKSSSWMVKQKMSAAQTQASTSWRGRGTVRRRRMVEGVNNNEKLTFSRRKSNRLKDARKNVGAQRSACPSWRGRGTKRFAFGGRGKFLRKRYFLPAQKILPTVKRNAPKNCHRQKKLPSFS